MSNTIHSRAKAGGELGANGEWYEGGKFIATTDHAKKLGSQKKKATGKQQVEQGIWELAPMEGLRAIYPQLAGVEIPVREAGKIVAFKFNPDLRGEYISSESIAKRHSMISAFNTGARWS